MINGTKIGADFLKQQQEAIFKKAYDEAFQQGQKIKQYEIANNLILMGMEDEFVLKAAELTKGELDELKKFKNNTKNA
ncbi:hypothetical protein SFC65_19390 [Priestia filamentosa]|uniref:hypothetical protein n=1 Tax=Priestia filamentosa TaxID=1402861 RepID=UPI003981F6E2